MVGCHVLRWLVFSLCGLQVIDYFCVDLCIDHEEVYQRFVNASDMHHYMFVLGKGIGIFADLLIMICVAWRRPALLELAAPMHIAAFAYNVTELDLKAYHTVTQNEPMLWSYRVYATIVIAVNLLRLVTAWYVYQYWCRVG